MIRFPRVRFLESVVLGHGPMWLDYYATALAPVCRELTVCFPDLPAYQSLEGAAKRWRSENEVDVRLEPMSFADGMTRLEPEEALARACRPGVDLSYFTFLDLQMLRHTELPSSLAVNRPALWGTWFNPADPAQRLIRIPKRAISKHAREEKDVLTVQRNPPSWLDGAFFLDSLMADRVNLAGEKRLLPDPWPTRPRQTQREARETLGLPLEGKLFFHFGVADERKGLSDVLRVWSTLPAEAILLRVGPLRKKQNSSIRALEREGRAIVHERFVPDDRVDLYFRAADWVLLPYRGHEGSSGVLSAAAAARRPVIATDYGVVGHRVRLLGLGELHKQASARSFANAVRRALGQHIDRYTAALDRYADDHTLAAFYEAFRRG